MMNVKKTNERITRTVRTLSESEFCNTVPSYYNNRVRRAVNDMINRHIINNPNRHLIMTTKVMRMAPTIERSVDSITGEISQATYVDHLFVSYNDTFYGHCVAEITIAYDHTVYTATGINFTGLIVSMNERASQEYDIERIPRKR